MRGFYFYAAAAMLLSFTATARAENDNHDDGMHEHLDSVIVSSSRAGKSTPVSYTMIGRDELRGANPINSLPMTLNLQPSVVTYNEGGTGLGNSAMTVRGSKGSQINVTLNGITLNDAESQEVFWVNIPALQSLISSVQLQRGLGTTASGSGAFGASINMSTASVTPAPYAAVDFSAGSWNTYITSLAVSTGLSKSGFYMNAAYSKGYTDGYIRNAGVDSQSAFVVLGWLMGNNSLRLTWLMGDQTSGITWDGIDYDVYNEDRRYNDAGEYYDEYGNVFYYGNAVDRYTQHHLQLNYTHAFSGKLTWTSTVNYTRGDGYDEYYKEDKTLSNYGFSSLGAVASDIIYRKQMANDYWVLNSDLKYNGGISRITGGINVGRYDGDHFGTVLWAAAAGDSYDYGSLGQGNSSSNSWYWNRGVKWDASVFVRGEFDVTEMLTLYGDLQYRMVNLAMSGIDDDAEDIGYANTWHFFNPRIGATLNFSPAHRLYGSISLGHREPGRSDIKENVKGILTEMKPERMWDFELGYVYTAPRFTGSVNLYAMEYDDMLIETGKLSTSGYAIKENVPDGHRRGVELALAWLPASWLKIDANSTLSVNKIKDYVSYVAVDDGDANETHRIDYGKTDMLMSPSVIGMVKASVMPWHNTASNSLKTTTFSIDGKYVGKQYIDNTSRDEMKIPRYFVANFSVSHEFRLNGGFLGIAGYVNNLLNNKYYAYGWRWESYSKAENVIYSGIGVYPQATVNFMLKLSYRF